MICEGDCMNDLLLPKNNKNEFINKNKKFIYLTACRICKRKLEWENDDELSIALIAFNNACEKYEENRGAFHKYAAVVIKNSLIDYFRSLKNIPVVSFEAQNGKFDYIDINLSINDYEIKKENTLRAEEIILFSNALKKYKLSFSDIVKNSPSHIDTRNNILNIAFKCLKDKDIIDYIKNKKMLPVKDIVQKMSVKRKLIEKWRRYLLVLILIISSSEYPYLKSYLNITAGDKF